MFRGLFFDWCRLWAGPISLLCINSLMSCLSLMIKQKRYKRIITSPASYANTIDFDNVDGAINKSADALDVFHNQLNGFLANEKSLFKNFKSRKNSNQYGRSTVAKSKSKELAAISGIKGQLEKLKDKIIVNLREQKKPDDRKISQNAKNTIERETDHKLPALFKPYPATQPMMPYYLPYNPFYPPVSRKSSEIYEDQEDIPRRRYSKPHNLKSIYNDNKKYKRKFDIQTKTKLRKKLMKVFRVVAYVFLLKNLCQGIRKKKRQLFDKFWPAIFKKQSLKIRNLFELKINKFQKKMNQNTQLCLQITGEQSQGIIQNKKQSLKVLLNILLKCLADFVRDQDFSAIAEVAYLFCKHGSFVDRKVLTLQQKQLVCLSENYGYLRLDRNLEKSQIVNFFFMKMLIFNMLMHPQKSTVSKISLQTSKQVYQNYFFFASVLYEIMIEIQQKYIELVQQPSITIGNYEQIEGKFRVQCCPSLCLINSNYERGEMISGLAPQQKIHALFPISYWRDEIKKIQSIIDCIHVKIRKQHAQLVNQVYDYKNQAKFMT